MSGARPGPAPGSACVPAGSLVSLTSRGRLVIVTDRTILVRRLRVPVGGLEAAKLRKAPPVNAAGATPVFDGEIEPGVLGWLLGTSPVRRQRGALAGGARWEEALGTTAVQIPIDLITSVRCDFGGSALRVEWGAGVERRSRTLHLGPPAGPVLGSPSLREAVLERIGVRARGWRCEDARAGAVRAVREPVIGLAIAGVVTGVLLLAATHTPSRNAGLKSRTVSALAHWLGVEGVVALGVAAAMPLVLWLVCRLRRRPVEREYARGPG